MIRLDMAKLFVWGHRGKIFPFGQALPIQIYPKVSLSCATGNVLGRRKEDYVD